MFTVKLLSPVTGMIQSLMTLLSRLAAYPCMRFISTPSTSMEIRGNDASFMVTVCFSLSKMLSFMPLLKNTSEAKKNDSTSRNLYINLTLCLGFVFIFLFIVISFLYQKGAFVMWVPRAGIRQSFQNPFSRSPFFLYFPYPAGCSFPYSFLPLL